MLKCHTRKPDPQSESSPTGSQNGSHSLPDLQTDNPTDNPTEEQASDETTQLGGTPAAIPELPIEDSPGHSVEAQNVRSSNEKRIRTKRTLPNYTSYIRTKRSKR